MRRLLIVMVPCLVVVMPVYPSVASHGGTHVTGAITSDTTWHQGQAPYVITGVVRVAPGATLTIEPGVVVAADHDSRLDILGVLRAEGTALDPIVFEARRSGDRWHGIRFVGTATMMTVDDRSWLSHATVANATIGAYAGYDSPQIGEVTFRNNTTATRFIMPASDVAVSGSRFFNNRVAVSGWTASTISITGSDFWANRRNLVMGPKRPYDCVADDGVWQIRASDILRGPDQPWHSRDVVAAAGSFNSRFAVDARLNHWNTADQSDVEGRLFDTTDNSYSLTDGMRGHIETEPLLATPSTAWMPPGKVASPARVPDTHPDPPTFTRITVPTQGRCYRTGDVTAIRGVGGAPGGTLRRVQIAVRRQTSTGCQWLANRAGTLAPGGCGSPVWLDATGLHDWRFTLQRALPVGPFAVLSRSNHDGGAVELERNRVLFRVRPRT